MLKLNLNQKLISGSNDKSIKIWDLETGQCLKTLKGHIGSILGLKSINSNNTIISVSSDKSIKQWNTIHGKCIQTCLKPVKNWSKKR